MPNSNKWFVLINPTSGNGKAQKYWAKIETSLYKNGFDFSFHFTKSGKHNTNLVEKAIKQGFNKIICIGGDGTIHNTVNGIMSQKVVASSSISVGIIPIGTGNDWVKTHDIPKDIDKAIYIIKNGTIRQQDVGEIEFINSQQSSVFFNNLAGVGFDGYVVSKVRKYKRFGALAYLIGAVLGLFSFKNFEVEVIANSQRIKTKSLMVLIGLCKYSGGGMRLTKYDNPSDGLFDISIAKDFSKFDILKNILKLFNGNIVKLKRVKTLKTSSITISCSGEGQKPYIQADGELLGKGNIKISIIPQAFSFFAK